MTLGTSEDAAERFGPPERSFQFPGLTSRWRCECRPISIAPAKMVAIMYRRDGDILRQSGVGTVKKGRWVNTKNKPIEGDYLWTWFVDA